MFVKVIEPIWDAYEPLTSIVLQHSRGVDHDWMVKRACCFPKEALTDLKVPDQHTALHVIALGDYEYTGPNANGDAFTEAGGTYKAAESDIPIKIAVGNKQAHPTFVSCGRVYRNHRNQRPEYGYGPVLKSAHNDRMKRVELIIAVPNDEFSAELQKIASGQQVGWSMATTIDFDQCSICANKAKTRAEYCKHARDQLGGITKTGHQVFVFNDGMRYFDISQVGRPADRIAWTLRKVADRAVCVGGAQLAERLGLSTPPWLLTGPTSDRLRATVAKLATMEKELPVTMDREAACSCHRADLPPEDMENLQKIGPDALPALAAEKICLSVGDFLKLMLGNSDAKHHLNDGLLGEVTGLLPGLFSRVLSDDALGDMLPHCDSCATNFGGGRGSHNLTSTLRDRCRSHLSMDEAPLRRRIVRMVIMTDPGTVKTAQCNTQRASAVAHKLASAYAGYQVSLIHRHPADESFMRLLLLGNHLHGAIG